MESLNCKFGEKTSNIKIRGVKQSQMLTPTAKHKKRRVSSFSHSQSIEHSSEKKEMNLTG